MEFSFRKEYITGKSTITMSMGHEAFAVWLEQESSEPDWLNKLQQVLQDILDKKLHETKLLGKEFCLFLTTEEAKVMSNSLLSEDELEVALDEGFGYYDQESQAECGLEDFAHFIESWIEFVN